MYEWRIERATELENSNEIETNVYLNWSGENIYIEELEKFKKNFKRLHQFINILNAYNWSIEITVFIIISDIDK